MFKRRAGFFLFFLILSLRSIAAQPSMDRDATADKNTLIALEHQWLDAIERRDTSFLNSLLDNDFVDTTVNGRQRSKHDVVTKPAVRGYDTQTLQSLTVHLHGDVAVVNGANLIVGKNHSYTVTVYFTDVFQKLDGQWKAIAAQESLSAVR
jgi:ketosteroid isomerase-like protein